MMHELGFSQLQLGVILAAFAWGYAIFQFPGGLFTDRFGARKGMTLIMVGWGVVNLLTGLIPHGLGPTSILISLVGLRFLMGVVQAPLFPIVGGAVIRDWFPVSGWAFPNALTNAGLTFGSAATGTIVIRLIERVGWRGSFAATAPAAFVLAALWWWYSRDDPADHPAVSPTELARINEGRPPRTVHEERGVWKRLIGNRDVLMITVAYFCANYVFYFFFNSLFFYLVEARHFQLMEGGYLSAAPWMTGAVGAVIGGFWCDHLTKRVGIRWGCRLPSVIGLVAAALFGLAAAMATGPYMAVALLSLCLAGQQFTDSAAWAATTSISGRHAGTGCGIMNIGGNVVGGVQALLVPLTVREFGWVAAIGTGSALALLGAALWCWIRADARVDDLETSPT